jgi:hypothetical protein
MNNQYLPIKSSSVKIEKKGSWQGISGMLHEPAELGAKGQIAVIVMHSDMDYRVFPVTMELAKRGYRVLGANISDRDNPLDEKLLDVKAAIDYVRQIPGVQKVIVMGHSGGATLMSAYQNAAENGVQEFQGPEKLIKCSDIGELSPADGVMLLDSNYGNGAMTLLSLDPAVTSEDSGKNLDPQLNLFDPANGYNPKGSTYNDDFIRKYQKAQGERNNRLIDTALDRLHVIERGKGKYADDEPFIVPGAVQFAFNNKLFPQDIRLLSHTQKAWMLLHADGTSTTEIIPCVRRPRNGQSVTGLYRMGSLRSTVRTYLNSSAVRTNDHFGYNENSMYGIEWLSSYNCTPGNVMGISAPLLVMGMTGGYEYLASEIIYENAKKSKDKTIAFVEGATHNFDPARDSEAYPGQFGDTIKTMHDFVDKWLSQKARFLD